MKPPARVPFLTQSIYRRRRLGDLARMLPLAGVVLFFLPLLGSNLRMTGATGIWLFVCWAGLIAVAAWLARRLSPQIDHDQPAGDGGPADLP